ncbi:hypothetical protein ACC698_38855, partial [Rhizobium johnstonii]
PPPILSTISPSEIPKAVSKRPPYLTLPAHKGLFNCPTVINNVISLASVPVIMEKGAAFYRDFGMGRSRGTITLQIAGN